MTNGLLELFVPYGQPVAALSPRTDMFLSRNFSAFQLLRLGVGSGPYSHAALGS